MSSAGMTGTASSINLILRLPIRPRSGIQGTIRGISMAQFARRLSVRARIALVATLALVAVHAGPQAAAVPEKGTEILWDTYGIPHIFAPDHPSLFYAYGYAQMEGHAE